MEEWKDEEDIQYSQEVEVEQTPNDIEEHVFEPDPILDKGISDVWTTAERPPIIIETLGLDKQPEFSGSCFQLELPLVTNWNTDEAGNDLLG